MSLAEMYEKIASMDNEEQYEEISDVEKTAAEYDAAGRIMARGFADELNKLAANAPVPAAPQKPMPAPAPAKKPARNASGLALDLTKMQR